MIAMSVSGDGADYSQPCRAKARIAPSPFASADLPLACKAACPAVPASLSSCTRREPVGQIHESHQESCRFPDPTSLLALFLLVLCAGLPLRRLPRTSRTEARPSSTSSASLIDGLSKQTDELELAIKNNSEDDVKLVEIRLELEELGPRSAGQRASLPSAPVGDQLAARAAWTAARRRAAAEPEIVTQRATVADRRKSRDQRRARRWPNRCQSASTGWSTRSARCAASCSASSDQALCDD